MPYARTAAVAFYGHYDIQPAEEPDWRTNPFEMTAVDGYLCGRGTSDNKGPMLAFIYAVKVRQGQALGFWRLRPHKGHRLKHTLVQHACQQHVAVQQANGHPTLQT